MSKLFQISEEDLATLEHVLPELLSDMYPTLDNRMRKQWRDVQEIVKNVRWNYGPPLSFEKIPADGDVPFNTGEDDSIDH